MAKAQTGQEQRVLGAQERFLPPSGPETNRPAAGITLRLARPEDAVAASRPDAAGASSPETSRPATVTALRLARPEDAAAAQAVPLSAPHTMGGDLRTMALEDILLWAAARQKTGILHLRQGTTRRRLMFKDGVLHSAASNDPRDTLGQFLVRDGIITEEQLFSALLRQEEKGAMLGILLVADGHLTADQLKRGLRTQAEQIVYDLFLWTEGSFTFGEGQMPNLPMNLELDTPGVVAEGTRRAKRWQRIRERFDCSDITFRVQTSGPAPLDPIERRLFELAAAGKTLAEIALETRRSEFETAEYLLALTELSVLAVNLPGDARTEELLDAALARARVALADKRFDVALESFQEMLALDPKNHEARKGLLLVAEGRAEQIGNGDVPPDAVPELAMGAAEIKLEKFTPEENFIVTRVNGRWDVQSLVKLCPLAERETLASLARLVERKVIALR